MRWSAQVTVFGVKPQDVKNFTWMGDADNESDAARAAAAASAKRIYGDEGTAGFVNETHSPLYMATIGCYDGRGGAITRGRSIEMLIIRQ